jgi:hypothetical protein
VAVRVEALGYKSEGRGSNSRCVHWDFYLIEAFLQHCGPDFG